MIRRRSDGRSFPVMVAIMAQTDREIAERKVGYNLGRFDEFHGFCNDRC